jgi:hypothetical protein
LRHTPIYTGPPAYPLVPEPDRRVLALPSAIGGLQTGCATDGKTIFTNGIDAIRLGSQEKLVESIVPPTGGRVAALSLDLEAERWRHERPRIASIGGPPPKPVFEDVGDPVASGVAVANGVLYFTTVASGKLVALNAETGKVLKELDLGPVFSGPSVSRGRVYVGTGNTLFTPADFEAYFPKKKTGVLSRSSIFSRLRASSIRAANAFANATSSSSTLNPILKSKSVRGLKNSAVRWPVRCGLIRTTSRSCASNRVLSRRSNSATARCGRRSAKALRL